MQSVVFSEWNLIQLGLEDKWCVKAAFLVASTAAASWLAGRGGGAGEAGWGRVDAVNNANASFVAPYHHHREKHAIQLRQAKR